MKKEKKKEDKIEKREDEKEKSNKIWDYKEQNDIRNEIKEQNNMSKENKINENKNKSKEKENHNNINIINEKNENIFNENNNFIDNKINNTNKKEKLNIKESEKNEIKLKEDNKIEEINNEGNEGNFSEKYNQKHSNFNKKDEEDIWFQNKKKKKMHYDKGNEDEINLSKYLDEDNEQKIEIPRIKNNTHEQIKNNILKKLLANEQGINEENVDLSKITFISFKNKYTFSRNSLENKQINKGGFGVQNDNKKKGSSQRDIYLKKPLTIRSKNELNSKQHELNPNFMPDEQLNDPSDNKKSIPEILKINEEEFKGKIEKDKIDVLQKNFDNYEKFNIKDISFNQKDLFDENDARLVNLLLDKINSKIKEDGTIDEDDSFKIDKIEGPIEPKEYKNCNMDKDNIINELINNSQIYIYKFFEQISKCNLNFSEIGFCFIIDCSLYLGTWLKINNLIIILAILKVIEIIDIKFSILLTADDKFKVILKNYEDEKINFENLIEIIYESSMIKRFRSNLAKSIKTAIKYLKSERKNTVFWIFSDSLDESILYYKYWKQNLFNDATNSFIFFIEKNSSLNYIKNPKMDIITKLWNNFETKISVNPISKIKIIDLNINEKKIILLKIIYLKILVIS